MAALHKPLSMKALRNKVLSTVFGSALVAIFDRSSSNVLDRSGATIEMRV